MASTHDRSYEETLFVTSEIKNFQKVENLDDYLKIASRVHRRPASVTLWLNSLFRSRNLQSLSALAGIVVAVATVIILIVTLMHLSPSRGAHVIWRDDKLT